MMRILGVSLANRFPCTIPSLCRVRLEQISLSPSLLLGAAQVLGAKFD